MQRKHAYDNAGPPWTTQQQLWILGRVTEGDTQRQIHDDLSAETCDSRPAEVERWAGTLNAFQKRIRRLTKHGIDPAIDTSTGERCEFDLGTARGRYDWWLWLARTTTDLPTRKQAMTIIENLSSRFGDEDVELQMRTESMLIAGREILADWQSFAEVVAMELRDKVTDHPDAVRDHLADVLGSMPEAVRVAVFASVRAAHPAQPIVEPGECRQLRLLRLRSEMQSLSESDLAELQAMDDPDETT